MFRQYRVFSNQHGSWNYEGSFSARSRTDARSWFMMGDELLDYVRAFAPPERAKMLVTSGQFVYEFAERDFA